MYFLSTCKKKKMGFFISVARGEGNFHGEWSKKPVSTITVPSEWRK